MDDIQINSRRRILQNLALSIPLFGLVGAKKWNKEDELLERRNKLIEEFGMRDVRDLAEILADITLRIESLEQG